MKYYTKKFLQSKQFYDRFYLPDISLEHYVIWENCLNKLGTHEEAIEIVNNNYMTHCECFFNEDILFYNELSQYLKDTDGGFKKLDDYIFFKLRYYGTKFLDIVNENRNFFEEELKKFVQNNYEEALIKLFKANLHDAIATFEYNGNSLLLCYRPGPYEKEFEFFGVEQWEEKEFLKMSPTLIIDELYEESEGLFVYNTLWNHAEVDGHNYSEILIKFTSVHQLK